MLIKRSSKPQSVLSHSEQHSNAGTRAQSTSYLFSDTRSYAITLSSLEFIYFIFVLTLYHSVRKKQQRQQQQHHQQHHQQHQQQQIIAKRTEYT